MIQTKLVNPTALWPGYVPPVVEKTVSAEGKVKYHRTERAKLLRMERLRTARNARVMSNPNTVMRRIALADMVALRARIPVEQADTILKIAFELIFEKLAVGGRVNCTPLGTFETRTHKLSSYYDVKTSKRIVVNKDYRLATFRGSKALKANLKGVQK